jgi:hypothetical protein
MTEPIRTRAPAATGAPAHTATAHMVIRSGGTSVHAATPTRVVTEPSAPGGALAMPDARPTTTSTVPRIRARATDTEAEIRAGVTTRAPSVATPSGGYDAGQDYGSRSGGYGSGYAGGSSGGGAYGSSQGSGQNYGQSYGQSRGSMYADISPVDEHDTSGGTWRSGTMGERRSPKGYTRSDDRIREDVNDRLMQDYRVDPGDIEVSVEKGEVTLKGDVRSREEKFRAEQIAESVSGVSDVTNNLRVKKRSRNADSSTRSGEDNRVDSQSESKSSSGNSGISPIAGISSAGGSRTGTTSGSQSRNT